MEDLEKKTDTPQAPIPADVVPEKGIVAEPAKPEAEKVDKATQALIKMRIANREQAKRITELEKGNVAPPAPVVKPIEAPVSAPKVIAPAPAQAPAVSGVSVEEETKAIREMSADKDLLSVPGSIVDVLDMVDTDPRLHRLYEIDPVLGLREAKVVWMARTGITPQPITPKPSTPAGGMSGNDKSVQAIIEEIKAAEPGSKRYRELTNQMNALIKKR